MDPTSGPLLPGAPRQVSKSRFKAQAVEGLRGSMLRFDDPFAPVCENDGEAKQKE